MNQGELFYDTIYDAISNAVQASGGFKTVAGELWPTKKQGTAYARLKACLEDHTDEKLDPEEVLAIAKMAKIQGNHALMQYLGQELGYQVIPLEPEDERTALQRQYIEATKVIRGIVDRMDRAESRLKAVR